MMRNIETVLYRGRLPQSCWKSQDHAAGRGTLKDAEYCIVFMQQKEKWAAGVVVSTNLDSPPEMPEQGEITSCLDLSFLICE